MGRAFQSLDLRLLELEGNCRRAKPPLCVYRVDKQRASKDTQRASQENRKPKQAGITKEKVKNTLKVKSCESFNLVLLERLRLIF